MTPDYARELLEQATPGPWWLNLQERDGAHPEIDLHIGTRLARSADYKLADAAPELAGHYITLVEALEEMVAVIDAEDAHNRPETRISPREARQWMRKFCTDLLEKVVDK